MWKNNETFVIIAVIAVFAFIWYYSSQTNKPEYFMPLDEYGDNTIGVKEYLIDNMTCSKSCCGDQWPVPFDNLTADEIEFNIHHPGVHGPFVRTNMTCGNGIDGVGCPCIPKKAYEFLANRGIKPRYPLDIEPTLLIRTGVGTKPYDTNIPTEATTNWNGTLPITRMQTDQQPESPMTPLEQVQSKRSMFSDNVKINDTYRSIPLMNMDLVQSTRDYNS
jgi:hypothetical protein